MSGLVRILFVLIASLLAIAVVLAAYAGVTWLRAVNAPLPIYDGEATLAGLNEEVVIRRDAYAIPHIEAQSEADAWFALGFVHAQDRLFQMDLARRTFSGRLAALLGPPAARRDEATLLQGLPHKAQRALENFPQRDRVMLEAYAAGVNAYMQSELRTQTPEHILLHAEMEPWSALDSVYASFQIVRPWTDGLSLDRARLPLQSAVENPESAISPYRSDTPTTLEDTGIPVRGAPGVDAASGQSNAWAVDGQHSASGAPLLANDGHFPPQSPGLMYLARLSWPGKDVAGASFPGAPGVLFGRTETTAWSVTYATGSVDTADFSLLERDPNNSEQYLTPQGPQPYAIDTAQYRVRFSGTRSVTFKRSPTGRVVPERFHRYPVPKAETHDLAVLDHTDVTPCDCVIPAILEVARADDAEGIHEALSLYRSEPVNFIFADTQGAIGYVMPGAIPDRSQSIGANLVVNHSGRAPFTDLLPYEANPARLNPPRGRLISANQAVAGPDYPHYLSDGGRDVTRARRIAELLDGKALHDLDSFRSMQLDTVSIGALNLLPRLLQVDATHQSDAELINYLNDWDGRYDADSPAALIFTAWIGVLIEAIFADELGPFTTRFAASPDNLNLLRSAIDGELSHWCDDRGTSPEESCDFMIARSLTTARNRLYAEWGDDPSSWRWSEAAEISAPHPFSSLPLPVIGDAFNRRMSNSGGPDTLNVLMGPWTMGVNPEQGSSAFMRMIVDLSEPENALFALHSGQSGHFRSPHYGDLGELLSRGEYVKFESIGPNSRTLHLTPPRVQTRS